MNNRLFSLLVGALLLVLNLNKAGAQQWAVLDSQTLLNNLEPGQNGYNSWVILKTSQNWFVEEKTNRVLDGIQDNWFLNGTLYAEKFLYARVGESGLTDYDWAYVNGWFHIRPSQSALADGHEGEREWYQSKRYPAALLGSSTNDFLRIKVEGAYAWITLERKINGNSERVCRAVTGQSLALFGTAGKVSSGKLSFAGTLPGEPRTVFQIGPSRKKASYNPPTSSY